MPPTKKLSQIAPGSATANAVAALVDPAITARVDAAVDALIAAAPGALDTLNELAAALGDDPNFAATVTAALAAKIPLAGGTLTGPLVLPADAATALEAVPKRQVDAAVAAEAAARVAALAGKQDTIPSGTYVGAGTAIPAVNLVGGARTPDPTGAAFSTQAFIDALVAAERKKGNSAGGFGGSGIDSGGRVRVAVPTGYYKVDTDAINVPDYVDLDLQGSIMFSLLDTGALFAAVDYGAFIKGGRFRGGAVAIDIATANLNADVINIDDCHFDKQAIASIRTDGTSASTLLNVTRCKGRENPPGARFLLLGSGDHVSLSNSWVQGDCDYFFEVGGGARMDAKNVLGVPDIGSVAAWFKTVASGSVWIEQCHFGGENGGKTLIEANAGPLLSGASSERFIVVKDTEIYCSTKPVIKFNDIPNIVDVRGPLGITAGAHLYEFTSAIPAATVKAMGSLVRIREDAEARSVLPYTYASVRTTADRYLASREALLVS